MKTYTVKSSAVRQAKKDYGVNYLELGAIVNIDGKWAFEVFPAKPAKPAEPAKEIEAQKEEPGMAEFVAPAEPAKPAPKAGLRGSSSMSGACSLVWDIAGSMLAENPTVKRKEIIQACVDRGVAYYTARTQYQKYREACKASITA